jgi:hypothetical protein
VRWWARGLGLDVRADERRRALALAAVVLLAQCAYALAASAGDALFLARVGPRHLGTLFALSSVGLIATLVIVGRAADRADRRTLLERGALLAAVVMAGLAALAEVAPRSSSALVLVGSKQLAAGIDLLFWVLVAERFDARQARRLVPLFVLAGGAGLAIGSFAVGPIAGWQGTEAAIMASAAAFLGAGIAVRALGKAPGSLAGRADPTAGDLRGAWRAVRDSRLARGLALVVAIAGTFAPILYYLLATEAARELGDEAAIAGFLGQYRGVVHVVTLLAQALLAPALMARAGVAPTLLLAPIGAVAAAAAVAVRADLAVLVVAQASARLLDTAVQTPAERLTHNLLPRHVRGRVAGFVDGVAKRSGAIAGGLAASALVAYPMPLAAVTIAVAVAWLIATWWLRRRFADLAVDELASRPRGDDDDVLFTLVDDRAVDRLRRDLAGDDRARRELAVAIVDQLGASGRLDPAMELAAAARGGGAEARRHLLGAIVPRRASPGAAPDLLAVVDASLADDPASAALAVRALGFIAADAGGALAITVRERVAPLTNGRTPGAVSVAARVAMARLSADGADAAPGAAIHEAIDEAIDAAIDAALSGAERATAVGELTFELARLAATRPAPAGKLLSRGNALLRAVRGDADPTPSLAALADILAAVRDVAAPELVLLRQSAQAAAERLYAGPDAQRFAAVRVMAAVGLSADANVLARALGDPDEDVRRCAAGALRDLGAGAVSALLIAARFGRRSVRNDALEVLRDLRLGAGELDDLLEQELMQLYETTARLAPLANLPDAGVLLRRLDERAGEIAHTLFLTLEARLRAPAIGVAARRFLRARDPGTRARALEALDAALPRAFGRRVIDVLEPAPAAELSARAVAHLGRAPLDEEDAVREELHGADPIGRALVVHALGRSGRASHGDAIRDAAAAAVRTLDPIDLMRRLSGAEPLDTERDDEQQEDDMPRSVEAMMTLSQVPLFAELSTRQLSELANVVTWQVATPGEVVIAEGTVGDSMYFVLSGEMRVTFGSTDTEAQVRRLGPGEPFGEMALFEGAPRSATVTAVKRSRLGRIDHAEFEELVEDVPGIALAICRVLSRRIRGARDAGVEPPPPSQI